MAALFDGSDEEVEIKVNNAYATKYDNWRKKEELAKLKARYGNDADLGAFDEDSSSSEEEDDDAQELTEQLEKDFFKTLSCLKKKDPRIYDGNVRFFKEEYDPEPNECTKTKKSDKPIFLRDYERKIIVEQHGKFSEDEGLACPPSPTLIEEQEEIRNSFKKALQGDDGGSGAANNDGNVLGGLFEKRKKTTEELKKEDEDFREWLKGQQVQLTDKNTEKELKYLHDYWNDPKLDDNELFLKDYILNKKFLDPEDESHTETYDFKAHDSDDGLSEDEATIEKQAEFEHKYNFRFEEPDQDFLKRFPRTMENSMRKKDNRRREKRKQIKERKEAEKERMKEDLKRLKALKRKEILDKIEKLKEVTGNPNVGFEEDDLEGNFDPEKHDKRMSELFSQDFYEQEDVEELPAFPDLDEELEIEKWDNWCSNGNEAEENCEEYEPHCEDPDFNMDCEFNPTAKFQKEIIESTKGRKRNRKSKLAQALEAKKPIFDPSDKSFEQYVDEYYGLDFEDVIGDLPCRFKYRKVIPNSFGLTIEEILRADDKELNRWCSVKRTVQRRPDHMEEYDCHKFEMKSRNEEYKKKILPSLYQTEQEIDQDITENSEKKKVKKKKNKNKHVELGLSNLTQRKLDHHHNNQLVNENQFTADVAEELKTSLKSGDKMVDKNKGNSLDVRQQSKSRKRKHEINENLNIDCIKTEKRLKYDNNSLHVSENKIKNKKKKKGKQSEIITHSVKLDSVDIGKPMSRRKKKNIKRANLKGAVNNSLSCQPPQEKKKGKRRKDLGKGKDQGSDVLAISDERLKAYGLKPKKFKNYLKYGKTV